LLVGDLEAERLIERDVARGARFEESGASVGSGALEAVHHQGPAQSSPLGCRCDGDRVEEPAELGGQVGA
jgi:hypothetical protein